MGAYGTQNTTQVKLFCKSFASKCLTRILFRKDPITFKQNIRVIGADGFLTVLPVHKPIYTNGRYRHSKTPITVRFIAKYTPRSHRQGTIVLGKAPMIQNPEVDETPFTRLLEPMRFAKNKYNSSTGLRLLSPRLPTDICGLSTDKPLMLSGHESAVTHHSNWPKSGILSFRAIFKHQDASRPPSPRIWNGTPSML